MIGSGIGVAQDGAYQLSGAVDNYVELGDPVAFDGQLWFVKNNSSTFFPKYPRGLYYASSGVWDLTPLKVKWSEDSGSWMNWTNWADYMTGSTSVNIGDRVLYNGNTYRNLTGVQIATAPDTDTANWAIVTLENIIKVAKSGGDYTTIEAALSAADGVTKTSILIAPGVYTENNPLQGKANITLKSLGGQNTVEIQASNSNANLFNLVSGFSLDDLTVSGVSGVGFYAFELLSPGSVLLDDVIIKDCENGIHLNHVGGQLILSVVSYQGTLTRALFVEAGNANSTILSVVGTATIETFVYITGVNSKASFVGLVSESPNLTTGIYADDGSSVSGSGDRLLNAYDGVVVQGDNTTVRLDGLQLQNPQNDGFRIQNVGSGIVLALFATSIFGAGRYNFIVENPNSTTVGNGFTETDKSSIVAGAKFFAYLLDIKESDEALKILGELHVGTSLRPAESVFGAGDSHTFEYVYTFDGVSTYIDKTDTAVSPSSSTFSLDGITAGNALYIANKFPLTFEGIKIAITSAANMGTGEIIAEYLTGSGWVEFNGCTSQSTPGFLKYAKTYFNQDGSYHIKFNPYIRDTWIVSDPVGLGTEYYWMRFRVVTAITTSPIIQQIKIHTNRTEINTDGTIENHMDARVYKKLNVDAIRPLEGNMQSASIYVDENVGVGLENNRFTTVSDILGISFELPEDCDTSAPIIFVWKGKFASTGSIDFTIRRKIVTPGDLYTNIEPGASGDTVIVNTGTIAIAAADTREDFRVDIDISDAIPSRENGFGDEIWITLQYPTRGAGNFDYTKLSANYLSDFAGRHIRQ